MIGQRTKYFEKYLCNIIITQLSEYCYSTTYIQLCDWLLNLQTQIIYLSGSERGGVESGNIMLVIKMQMNYKKMPQIPENVYTTVV